MMLDASVIICAYTARRWDDFVTAVDSVRRQEPPPREIVVVVDHNPGLLNRVQVDLPDVVAVENREGKGLSGARNSGISASSGAIVAFLDDDAIAEPGWLKHLLAPYEDAHVAGTGGSVEPLWLAGRPSWFPEEFRWVVGCTYRGMPEVTSPVRNLIGCNMSFRREVFAAAGGFSNGIGRVGTRPVGCEETELCIRIQQHWPDSIMLYDPAACVRHRVPASRAGWRYFVSRCYSEGLSKALVAQLVGSRDGLSSERAYTLRTLPRGVLVGLADGFRGKLWGPARSAAIVLGLACTSAGYVVGKMSERTVSETAGLAAAA